MSTPKKRRFKLNALQRKEIKLREAAFVQRLQTAYLNPHQQAIVEAARRGSGRYVVIAGPGSGKSFTSIYASTVFEESAIYFVFNKKVQHDTESKFVAIDSPMVPMTVHAFGMSCLQAHTRGKGVKYG